MSCAFMSELSLLCLPLTDSAREQTTGEYYRLVEQVGIQATFHLFNTHFSADLKRMEAVTKAKKGNIFIYLFNYFNGFCVKFKIFYF